MVKMTFLEELYANMVANNVTQIAFTYRRNGKTFSVLFDTAITPYALLFCVAEQNLFLKFEVNESFVISNTMISRESYKMLVRVLDLNYDPANRFSPSAFLENFNNEVHVPNIEQANYGDRRVFFPHVEERDKPYFLKWLPHNGSRKVTPENLEKTRCWLGEEAYHDCKERNISTCWTDNEAEEKDPWRENN